MFRRTQRVLLFSYLCTERMLTFSTVGMLRSLFIPSPRRVLEAD